MTKPPEIYDAALDAFRPATQTDLDHLVELVQKFAVWIVSEPQKETKEAESIPGRLRVFKNPMRDDGVFVHEDLPIEQYEGIRNLDGNPVYPAIPSRGFGLIQQLPTQFAEEMVRRWNKYSEDEGR